jgi:DNA repair protein RadC
MASQDEQSIAGEQGVSENRKQKLQSMLYAIRDLNDFSPNEAKLVCRDLAPAYVTLTLKKLVRGGLLNAIATDAQERLRWVTSDKSDLEQFIERQIYGDQVKQTPEQDRPREILLRDGAARLTTDQLIAILIRVGVTGESAVQAGRKLANRFAERLTELPDAGLAELRKMTPAIRKDSFSQIMAGIELGRRIAALKDEQTITQIRIKGCDDAIRYCMKAFSRLALDGKQEQFHIVTLDTQHGPIANHLITVGTLDASLVHPREVFRPAIRDAASAILLVHNHPSGDPTPSAEDRAVTRKLRDVGNLIGIQVLDHIVVARERGRSIMSEEI